LRCLFPIALAFGITSTGYAQAPLLPQPNHPLPEFEAATIKPSSVNYAGIYVKPGGRIEGGQCTVSYLVTEAFNIPQSRITGGPKWVDSAEFDIEAVPPDDSPARQYNPAAINSQMTDDQRLMLQALLRDRFGLKYHVAKQEQPVFFLQRSGKPLKLAPPKDPKGRTFMGVNTYSDGKGDGEVVGTNTTMGFTALRLSRILRRTVIDRTDLTGSYDFHVEAPDTENADRINSTIEGMKALGLELKSGKAPVDTIMIDEVSQPTPN
jgi:uncharacterized protein (TIGR03435 family)